MTFSGFHLQVAWINAKQASADNYKKLLEIHPDNFTLIFWAKAAKYIYSFIYSPS